MNLYLLTQDENSGYDSYDSCVVVATSPEDAILITPDNSLWSDRFFDSWCSSPEQVTCTYIGIADGSLSEGSVICSSFNAG